MPVTESFNSPLSLLIPGADLYIQIFGILLQLPMYGCMNVCMQTFMHVYSLKECTYYVCERPYVCLFVSFHIHWQSNQKA